MASTTWTPALRGASLWAAEEEPGVIEQEVFTMLDADRDGHLSLEEMAPLLGNNSSRACAVAAQMRRCRSPQAGFTPREFAAAFREDNRVVEFYQEKFHESIDATGPSSEVSKEWLETLPAESPSKQRRTARRRALRVEKEVVVPVGVARSKRNVEHQAVATAKWQETDWSWDSNNYPRRWIIKKPSNEDEAVIDSSTKVDEGQFRQRRRTAPAGAMLPDISTPAPDGTEMEDGEDSAALRRTWRPVFPPRRRSCLGPSEIAAEVVAEEVAAESMRQPSAHLDLAAPSIQQVTELETKLQHSQIENASLQSENASLHSINSHLRAEVAALITLTNQLRAQQATPTREVLAAASDAAASVQQSRWKIVNPTTGEEVAAPSDASRGPPNSDHFGPEERQRAWGGSAAETMAGLIFEPSFGSYWDWPLSRQEKKERILMINQIQLLDEIEELRSRPARCESAVDEESTC